MNIVVGFIDTREGHAAVETAIAEAHLREGRLILVNSMFGGSRESEEEYVSAADAFEALQERLRNEGVPFEAHEFVRGNSPAEDIIAAARESAAELIVIGIRRRSPTGKLLLGSNALDILHDAEVPVLCVKAAPA